MKYSQYCLLLLLIFFFSCKTETVEIHPFEAYLAEVDPAFEYELANTIEGEDYTAYVIRMVSQEWLTDKLVNETKWWHWLTIVVPDEVEHETGFLWIGGGTNYSELPESVDPMILNTARSTNSITADLHNVPFQPISFLDDDRLEQRYEDDLIAYGWRKFLEGGAQDEDAEWLARLPMTTAAVRAMDTITDFIYKEYAHVVENYVVGGASKRGWTTWTTAVFDERVVAIVPVVIDLLNVVPSFQHHWQSLGEWSPAIEEYENEIIMDWIYSEEFIRMLELTDPYSYLDRLTMPKYIINAASDEFFLPDSWQFYWNDLQGDKYLRYVPNTGHSMRDTDTAESVAAFHSYVINREELPQFEWSTTATGFEIQLDPDNLPDELLLWNAHNPDARDFRLYVIDRIWISQELEISEDGNVLIELEVPTSGFTAWFVEATFNSDLQNSFKQTTGVLVTPDEYPFEPFSPQNPLGTVRNN
ncbi:MAG: PhoPQ-activated pathogenicity-related family protein [Balneolaceae bacterium]|nr:PhoPQ-activated pathogenicity-related family protein [Balneolaceae bacterium]